MKIGFYSSAPLTDRRNWSGTMFKMYEQLIASGHEVHWIPRIALSPVQQKRFGRIRRFLQSAFHRGYNEHLNLYKARIVGQQIDRYLKEHAFDVIFAPTAVTDFALTRIAVPIIYLNDANVAQLLNYYPYYSGFGWLSKKETRWVEKKMLEKASVNIFSSAWAADYAVAYYGIDPAKVKVLKFGANLPVPQQWEFSRKLSEPITFLFLAVDWQRKRGDLAYRTLKLLKEKGHEVRMQIIGCHPAIIEDWVDIIPFLNKNNPEELRQIQHHLSTAHFLFVPTEADCTPIAFCEAAGFGLPVISADTGGVSAHVESGKTGLLLPHKALAEDYASAIENILKNPESIAAMSKAARLKYEQELNWEVWRQRMDEILLNI